MSSESNNSTSGSTSEAKLLDERRRRMLERLNARHAAQSEAQVTAVKSEAHIGSVSSFDHLRARVNELLKSSDVHVDPSLLKELEDVLAVLPSGPQSRRFQEAYSELRARLQQQLIGAQKAPFSFSSKPLSKPKLISDVPSSLNEVSGGGANRVATSSKAVPCNSITVADKEGEFVKVIGKGGEDVLVVGLRSCRVSVQVSASAVHLKDVHDSTLVLAPVSSSVLIRNCSGLTLVAAAQQIRVHSSHNLRLHIAVRGAVVIEDCDGFLIAPYRVSNIVLDWTNDNWRKVQDFNWLSDDPDPHWCVTDESLWQMFDIDTCEPCSSH
ncbi:Tubulin-specific chaperone C [Toxocara canis]|uniref:Tubulin-specific chaperone C n=1 Tax=Toxocara canis TaxID=6265 RepID=A0A0B2UWL4_TOXCA|nr:Tubulin-specific chaperone C [Toxocara canis]